MCRPASFIVTKDKVLWSLYAENHETIIEDRLPETMACPNCDRTRYVDKEEYTLLGCDCGDDEHSLLPPEEGE